MATILTTIQAEVVKTAAIRKFSHAPMLVPSSSSTFDSQLLLLKPCPPGVLWKRAILRSVLESFEGVLLEWDLQMVGVLTISMRIVVKTAAIGNLGPCAGLVSRHLLNATSI